MERMGGVGGVERERCGGFLPYWKDWNHVTTVEYRDRDGRNGERERTVEIPSRMKSESTHLRYLVRRTLHRFILL